MYHFRSETDIKAPFEDISEEIDVKLLDLSTRKLRHYENSKRFFYSVKILFTLFLSVKKVISTEILKQQ